MNPFQERVKPINECYCDWKCMAPKTYSKKEVDPYTKLRIILMNGAEYEAIWHSHQFYRHCADNDIRRNLTAIRRVEQQQQKRLASLKPIDESILEVTIGYEQLAVDLTSALAKREPNASVKATLDFALLEDFDHLYRYANLLDMEHGIKAENLVGKYAEIMPARPTIAEHRHPYDSPNRYVDYKNADAITKLNIGIITAAEQQTMNYYNNVGAFYSSELGRKLYTEIAMIEEQHVSEYGSLMDATCTWTASLLEHEYTECYLYYSCYVEETDPNVKKIWEMHLTQEIAHLQMAAQLLQKIENREYQEIIPIGKFPEVLHLGSNIDYVRDVISRSSSLTKKREDYMEVKKLKKDDDFFVYQGIVNDNVDNVASHVVIKEHINKAGEDYRFETKPHPIEKLSSRKKDNTDYARTI